MQNEILNANNLCNLVESGLETAKKFGATDAEISLNESTGFMVNVRMGEIETLEHLQNKSLGITVYIDKRKANISITDFCESSIKNSIEKACHMASHVEEDDCVGSADKSFLARDYPELDLCHPWKIDVKQAITLVKQCEKLGFAENKLITNSEGSSLSTNQSLHIYGNTNGFLGFYPSTFHSLSCILIASKDGNMQRDYSYTISRNPNKLDSLEYVAKTAASRTASRLGAKAITTRCCPVIFEARIAKDILAEFISAINGYSIYRKSSFLLDKINEKVFADHISVDENPHLLQAIGSSPFDAEGVATKKQSFVKNGVLQGYILDSYTGRKLNMPTTGNSGGIHNIIVNSSEKNLSELIKTMHKGLLVTEILGSGGNTVTGDFSHAAFGFWVENGEIQYPVENITIASNLRDMFLNIVEIGNDVYHNSNIFVGSMLISNMTIAGNN